jgi:hypothetical protein
MVNRALIFILLFICGSVTALPATLRLEPAATTVMVSDTLAIDIVVEGLGDASPPSLGGYDLLLSIPSVFTLANDPVPGDPDLGNQLDFGFGTLFVWDLTGGQLNLAELSFEDPATLNSLQPDSFVIARLQMLATAPGNAVFSVTGTLTDEIGNELPFEAFDAQVTVEVIPEPATAGLTVSALAAGILFAYRNGIKSRRT